MSTRVFRALSRHCIHPRKQTLESLVHVQRHEIRIRTGDHGLAFVQQDVLRLDVAMDHAAAMRIVQRTRDLALDPVVAGDDQERTSIGREN